MQEALDSSGESPRMRLVDRWGYAVVQHPVITLFGLWLLHLAYLGILQAAGLSYGFAVWPMGEDRNWLRFMLDAPGIGMVREFWQMNDRNPLSPWWYWLFSKPILGLDWGLYAVRKVVDVFLAVVVVLLFRRLFREPRHPVPLLLGMLVLFCNFSGYHEQIIWNFLVASGFGLAALYFYARFVDSGRAIPYWLAAALIAFLIAIATYTLNLGMLIAVVTVALLRHSSKDAEWNWGARARTGIIEIAMFVTIAAVFVLIWFTTSRASSDYYHLDLSLASEQFVLSAQLLLWHPDFTYHIANAYSSPEVVIASLPLIAGLLLIVLVVALSNCVSWKITAAQLGWCGVVFTALAATVVLLESTSNVWPPGTRSPMIYQLSAPILLLLLAGTIALVLQRVHPGHAARVWLGSVAGLALICTAAAGMFYNRILVERTDVQRRFSTQLTRIVEERYDIYAFVVRYGSDPKPIWGSDALSDTYARTILRRRDVTLRFLQTRPSPPPLERWWRVHLGPDRDGIRHASTVNDQLLPYARVLFLDWDGTTLSVPDNINEQWLEGLQADWRRIGPIKQTPGPTVTCPTTFDFSTSPPRGEGWSVPERHPNGGFSMWMASTFSRMTLPVGCEGPMQITLSIAGYMSQDIIDGMRLTLDGSAVPLTQVLGPDGRLQLTGLGPSASANKRVSVEMLVPRTIVPAGGNRPLAVMFRKLEIKPATSTVN